MSDWDAVIIGSGLGGLSAGAYLAANGQRGLGGGQAAAGGGGRGGLGAGASLAANGERVLVCEQYDVAGGCSQVFRRKREWQFDVGLHYVGGVHTGDIASVLRGVGLEGRMDWIEMDPDGFDTLLFPEHSVRVPKGWDRYAE